MLRRKSRLVRMRCQRTCVRRDTTQLVRVNGTPHASRRFRPPAFVNGVHGSSHDPRRRPLPRRTRRPEWEKISGLAQGHPLPIRLGAGAPSSEPVAQGRPLPSPLWRAPEAIRLQVRWGRAWEAKAVSPAVAVPSATGRRSPRPRWRSRMQYPACTGRWVGTPSYPPWAARSRTSPRTAVRLRSRSAWLPQG